MLVQTRKRAKPLKIVIAQTGTTEQDEMTVVDIDYKDRRLGYFGCRYHYVITRDGDLQEGRPTDNTSSLYTPYDEHVISVCLVGGRDEGGELTDNFNSEQKQALREVIKKIRRDEGQPDLEIALLCNVAVSRSAHKLGPMLDLSIFE